MKESSEWIRQSRIDEVADAIVAEKNCDVSAVKGSWVASALGRSPGGELYQKVRDWKRRRKSEQASAAIEVPAAAIAAFQECVDRAGTAMMANFVANARDVANKADEIAMLRVAEAERRSDEADRDYADLLEACQLAESQRDDTQREVTDLRNELDAARRQEQGLKGRLTQAESAAADMRRLVEAIATARHAATADEATPPGEEGADTAAPVSSSFAEAAERLASALEGRGKSERGTDRDSSLHAD